MSSSVTRSLIRASDPLPWSWLARDRELCGTTKFVDVDHEALMVSKCDVVLDTPKMKDLLTLRTPKVSKGVLIDSDEYVAIGCDLRNVKRLDRLIRSVVPVEECLVLCIAEVSIAYMDPDDADAVISWSSTLSSGECGFHTRRYATLLMGGRRHFLPP